jgi:hypothetical protein
MAGSTSQPETRQQRAERLAPLAVEWAARLRDEQVDTLAGELLDPLPRRDLYGLIGLLGGAADVGVSPDLWWRWVRLRDLPALAAPVREPEEALVEDTAPPPVRDPGGQPSAAEEAAVGELLVSMLEQWYPDAEIAAATGLSTNAVKKRRHRLGVFRRPARAGVG